MKDYAHIDTSEKPSVEHVILLSLAFILMVLMCVIIFAIWSE